MNSVVVLVDNSDDKQNDYDWLMASARGHVNDHILASMYAGHWAGEGSLPVDWGMSRTAFVTMMHYHFPGCRYRRPAGNASSLPTERLQECEELQQLLLSHRAHESPSELWMATIVSRACMADNHLWQDLGLWSRTDLGRLMHNNFPSLAEKNDRDMKWKKFLYKQLCDAEGIYVCRSPSCEVCSDYQACFGPEE